MKGDTHGTPTERLHRRLERKPNGCLEWTGYTNPGGYGEIGVDGKKVGVHRLAWTLNKGPIPPGIHVLHHCDQPPCCETEPSEAYPDGHLFLGTDADNMADMAVKGRSRNQNTDATHCNKGHFFDSENTYVKPNGHRGCRKCRSAARAR